MTRAVEQTAAAGPNWALRLGLLLTAAALLLAGVGPALAPADPLKENFIVLLPEGFVKPPFGPLQVPGYPLGADEFGRDLFSRLLWAVRPTLTLVIVVAAVRLVLGLGVGLITGWSAGPAARVLNGLAAVALTLPVLLAALLVIAAAGQRWGVWAFITGLSLTGWAEVARLVREQTRLTRGQRFVEAARALGASEAQILSRHVLPHLLPLMWIWLALEASSALLATASLGFLGYFINAVWIQVGDWSGIQVAGNPELGQMLTYSGATKQPWAALAAGTLVLVIVLGFNWLGEGLRREFSPEHRRRPNWLGRWIAARLAAAGDRVFFLLDEWQRAAVPAAAGLALALMIGGGSWWLWAQTARPANAAPVIKIPGGHLWASARHDASGTLYAPVAGPAAPEITWQFGDAAGLYPPVIAADGTLYLVSGAFGGSLLALTPQGARLWQSAIPDAQFPPRRGAYDQLAAAFTLSVPALSAAGEIIVVDGRGQVTAFAPAGTVRWTWRNPRPAALLAQPVIGPGGQIYFATELNLTALGAAGALLWQVDLPTYSYVQPVLRVSGDGQYLAFQDVLVSARTGATVVTAPESLDTFIFGTDGQLYLRKPAELQAWRLTETQAEITPRVHLDARGLALGFSLPGDSGVLPDGSAWFHFGGASGGAGKVVWVDPAGQAPQVIVSPRRGTPVMAVDARQTAYLCDTSLGADVACAAYQIDGTPLWQITLDPGRGAVLGAALAPARLYVVTSQGILFALGAGAP